MRDLRPLNLEPWDFSISQLAALPGTELQEYDANLNDLIRWAKQARERLNAALEQRYGEAAKAERQAIGKDFGVIHLKDDSLHVTIDLPKRVSWDQAQLADIARRIRESGECAEDYLDIEYAVAESRYHHWPATLKTQFESARLVKPGKPAFRLALITGESS